MSDEKSTTQNIESKSTAKTQKTVKPESQATAEGLKVRKTALILGEVSRVSDMGDYSWIELYGQDDSIQCPNSFLPEEGLHRHDFVELKVEKCIEGVTFYIDRESDLPVQDEWTGLRVALGGCNLASSETSEDIALKSVEKRRASFLKTVTAFAKSEDAKSVESLPGDLFGAIQRIQ